jgi:GNAT superfamily N-acetyltransferase
VRARSYRLRAATVSDLPDVRRCLRAAFDVYRRDYTPEAFRDTVLTARSAKRRFGEMHILVALDRSGSVVGTIAWRLTSPSEAHLRGMAVTPEWLGTGVAQALLERAIDEVSRAGCHRVTLNTTLPLRRAVRFYRRNRFRRSGRTSDFFGMELTGYVRVLDAPAVPSPSGVRRRSRPPVRPRRRRARSILAV